MATFSNDLRLKEITTGDEDGTWGTSTNTNLELIADAFGFGTKEIPTDANATFTIPDGSADGTRAFYLKITSAVSLTATRTVTLAPNTVSKVWLIENATTGTQSITLSQGSGANVTVPKGQRALIVSDGAGASAAIVLATPTVLLASGAVGTLPVANGGTGQSTYTNGQLLIGNTTGNTLSKATLTAGTGVTVTNGTGTITIAAVNNGTVTSVGGTGTVNGITLTGTVTSSGNLTLGGTLAIAATQVTSGTLADARIPSLNASKITAGTLADARIPSLNASKITAGTFAVARGGTGRSTLTSGRYLKGAGTSAIGLQSGIPAADITSGTFSTARIPNLNASKITAGTLPVARGGTGVTTSTGTGATVRSTSPALVTPALGTPTSGNLSNCTFPTLNQSTTGNAATATALQTARTIGGVSFNGTANINLPGVNQAGNQNTTGSAATLTTPRAINGVNFNGSAAITITAAATNVATRLLRLGVGTAASGTTGEIRATNNITAFFSDRRLKTDITPITHALSKICSVSGVTFKSNDIAAKYGYTDQKLQVGVIAQEIQKVLPQVVVAAPFDIGQKEDGSEYSVSGENFLTVHYEKIIPLLIEAIKELSAKVEFLEAK